MPPRKITSVVEDIQLIPVPSGLTIAMTRVAMLSTTTRIRWPFSFRNVDARGRERFMDDLQCADGHGLRELQATRGRRSSRLSSFAAHDSPSSGWADLRSRT
jgi:hypothetical protein